METNSLQEQITNLRERVSQNETEFGKRTNIMLDEMLVVQQNLSSITEKIERLTEKVDLMAYGQLQLQNTVTDLSGIITDLSGLVTELVRHDRSASRQREEDRAEIRRIWEYLQLQQRNQGNGQG